MTSPYKSKRKGEIPTQNEVKADEAMDNEPNVIRDLNPEEQKLRMQPSNPFANQRPSMPQQFAPQPKKLVSV